MLTKEVRVYGIVQGVGFRPTVDRHANEAGVCGTVCNKGPYVEIIVQGEEANIAEFLNLVERQAPKRSAILKLDVKPLETDTVYEKFSIISSEKIKGEIFISPDIATCDECRSELFDKKNKRYLHPFINCTSCGPRLTILDALPYDRERTSMKEFPMCGSCAEEYHNPESRRYDAQPVCCNDCGPEVYLLGEDIKGRDAIIKTRQIIRDGGIVAIKGIGGFHLCCDATNEDAVKLLRERKHRPAKPFAVMMRDIASVERECSLTDAQRELMTGHQKPIILLDRRNESSIAQSVAPGNPRLGVMLPYAPVQMLIFDYDDGHSMPDCLVMTSGNTSGAPICRSDEDAEKELRYLCDAILSHDRKIRIRSDDSVTDFYKDEPYMIRRSRGFAPLPFIMSKALNGKVLAVGGELKNSFCIGVNNIFYPSPYIGDLEDLRTVNALRETIDRFKTLLEAEPTVVACDLHPKYNSTAVAEELGLPIEYIQHHYAHVVSCMAENDYVGKVIGVSFDGTGYGTDGTIWGGEILISDYYGFERAASIAPFKQIGGDVSAKEGWRIAVSMLYDLYKSKDRVKEIADILSLCDEQNATVQMNMWDMNINSITSTSAGRLFDGVSAILGICRASTFESEASTSLQFAAERFAPLAGYKEMKRMDAEVKALAGMDSSGEYNRTIMPTDALVRYIAEEKLKGEDSKKLAFLFHYELAQLIAEACNECREKTGLETVALSGGVFQNTLLLKLTETKLENLGFKVLRHRLVPPNDGGIALGQAVAAMIRQEEK